MATFLGVPATAIKGRPVVEVGRPVPLADKDDGQLRKHGLPAFTVSAEGTDYAYAPFCPIKQAFVDRFIIGKSERASQPKLAVFFALASTTRWATAYLLIDGNGDPVLTKDGKGLAILKNHGNRTVTTTIRELSAKTGYDYYTVSKALREWEKLGVIELLNRTYSTKKTKENAKKLGRKEKLLRYEILPQYVWNGPIGLGTGYENLSFEEWQFL